MKAQIYRVLTGSDHFLTLLLCADRQSVYQYIRGYLTGAAHYYDVIVFMISS